MLTRSLSYYTLSRQPSLSQQQFDLLRDPDESSVDVDSTGSATNHSHSIHHSHHHQHHRTQQQQQKRASDGGGLSKPSMPRSISLNKLSYINNGGSGVNSNNTTPYKSKHHNASRTTVELVEEFTPPSKSELPSSIDIRDKHDSATPPTPGSPLEVGSTSPAGSFLTTETGSLPIPSRVPLVGNALIHPIGDLTGDPALTRLPAALVEDFEIVGRAGSESTCDTWIVRSKYSGKLAVFKPRDGESFQQRQQWEEKERERADRLRRAQRLAARGGGCGGGGVSKDLFAEPSSSCPHPLSLTTNMRTPLKRGVLYGETTRKEVAAYILDHEHFAGVPKTLEATIFLARQDAPNQGVNQHDSGVYNYHPYLHGSADSPSSASASSSAFALGDGGNHTFPPHSDSPELAGQGRLLLQAASNSPSLSACNTSNEPQFAFDAEEVWLPAQAASNATLVSGNSSSAHHTSVHSPLPNARGTMFGTPDPKVVYNNNLAPPTLLSPTASIGLPSPPSTMPVAVPVGAPNRNSEFHSPELTAQSGSPPNEFRGIGLGLPASTSELIATYGSLQEFVENKGSAEDIGSNSFSADEVHRIGILDVRLLNLDRHLGNLLVQRDTAGQPHLIPIDHGFCLPSYTELSDVHLEWTYWRQCAEPFGKETLRYIHRLDPIADAAKLRNLGIRDEGLVSMVFSSLLLKLAAASGLTLFHIARMIQRDADGDEPSTLETIVARVLGSQQVEQSPEPPPSTTSSSNSSARSFDFGATGNLDTLPAVEEESYSPSHQTATPCHLSRQTSTSSNIAPLSPYPTPPLTPHMTRLTRSNSDGAMALAEAINGRPYSPIDPDDLPQAVTPDAIKRTTSTGSIGITRRRSIADAAAHMIKLVSTESATSSPNLSFIPAPVASSLDLGRSATSAESVESTVTPPPPSMIRLGTELTLRDPNAGTSSASSGGDSNGDIPTGAKLQQLLLITETVIRDELAAYCARHKLTPIPTSTHLSSTKDDIVATTMNGASPNSPPVHSSPRMTTTGSIAFNTSIRGPMSPDRPFTRNIPISPRTPTRSASEDTLTSLSTNLTLAPSALLSTLGSAASGPLAMSIRPGRSSSIDSLYSAAAAAAVAPHHRHPTHQPHGATGALSPNSLPPHLLNSRQLQTGSEAHTPPVITAES